MFYFVIVAGKQRCPRISQVNKARCLVKLMTVKDVVLYAHFMLDIGADDAPDSESVDDLDDENSLKNTIILPGDDRVY